MIEPDPLHVAARRALLDALDAAQPFRQSLIVVGAQAVYLRTASARLTLKAFTTDGDLLIDPSLLPASPPLDSTLRAAGFIRSSQPGRWQRAVRLRDRTVDVAVDFMVPEAVAPGSGRRSVELEGHSRLAARRVYGLEAALVDHSPVRVESLDPADSRSASVAVAGPAALLIAKVHKISGRIEADRHQRTSVDKDAADVYRLIQATSVADMAAGFRLALSIEVSRSVAELAMRRADQLFGRRTAVGVEMASRAIGVVGESRETIAAVLMGYTSAVLAELGV
jgi:Nucleotidyltransferase